MHDLEPSPPAAEDGTHPPHIPRLPLLPLILDHDIADLKDPKWERVLPVFADGLEHAGEEGGADNLVFDRLGVGEDDGEGTRVDAVEELEVLVVRALMG